MSPFAGYGDFDDCVSSNSDKKDPEAYCGAIKHRVEKALETGQISDELAALITMSDNADVSEEATEHWESRVVHLDDSPASEEELNSLSQKTNDVSRRETDSFVCWTAASQNQTIYKAVEADDDGDTPRGNADEDGFQEKGDFSTDLFYVISDDMDGKIVGIGVDFPNSGVYVDWINEAWPEGEQLDEPHVSDYGSIADLEQATNNSVELAEHHEFDMKGEFDPSVLGTDGVPGDRQSFESFLDALVDAGADVFTVRNGELQVWPDDNIDDADPHIQVVGIPDSEVLNILDRFNLEFMKTPEVENASDN